MSLATRCTSCTTVFRVVHDQLKVSEGWVRCGRCNEVFNAQANLVELDAYGQPLLALAGTSAEIDADTNTHTNTENPAAALGVPAPGEGAAAALALDTTQVEAAPTQATQTALTVQMPASEAWPFTAAELDDLAPPTQYDSRWPEDERVDVEHVDIDIDAWPGSLPSEGQPVSIDAVLAAVPVADGVAALSASPATATPDLHAEPTGTPSFIRQADRAARWQRAGVRRALGLAACLLTLALAAQWLLHQRDWAAAHWPISKPWLEAVCKLAACQIQPLRNVELLSVESTALTRIEGSSLYRVNMVLRNRAQTELLMPAIDLALTDAQGQIISRRVLSAAELGSSASVVAAGTDVALQAMLSTGSRRVAGYTIEVFYP